jgi:hypothetical protein
MVASVEECKKEENEDFVCDILEEEEEEVDIFKEDEEDSFM